MGQKWDLESHCWTAFSSSYHAVSALSPPMADNPFRLLSSSCCGKAAGNCLKFCGSQHVLLKLLSLGTYLLRMSRNLRRTSSYIGAWKTANSKLLKLFAICMKAKARPRLDETFHGFHLSQTPRPDSGAFNSNSRRILGAHAATPMAQPGSAFAANC